MNLEERVWDRLRQVIDPELNINLVDLGLIYKVKVNWDENGGLGSNKIGKKISRPQIFIQMTLTTPGCPLAAMFDPMIRESLLGLSLVDDDVIDIERDVAIELTFDPPWVVDMMSEEAKAELGF